MVYQRHRINLGLKPFVGFSAYLSYLLILPDCILHHQTHFQIYDHLLAIILCALYLFYSNIKQLQKTLAQ